MSVFTNIYVKSGYDSILVIESMKRINSIIKKMHTNVYKIMLDGKLIMATDTINVYDGLIDTIKICEENGKSFISVELDHPSSYKVERVLGMPEKLVISFDRSHIRSTLRDRVIVIDPGHGGKDSGSRGYINLLEKNVTIDIAQYLKEKLNSSGACSVLTREKDINLNLKDRLHIASILDTELFVSIHTHWAKDKSVGGCMGIYSGKHSHNLCDTIIAELGKKLELVNLGVLEEENTDDIAKERYIDQIPYVEIRVCTISNPVEEGWLRSPVFKERAAQAVMNGIIKYLQNHVTQYNYA